MDTDKKTITLDHPLKMKLDDGTETTLTEIHIGRLKVKNLKKMPLNIGEDGTIGDFIPVIASTVNLPETVLEDMDSADFSKIMGEFEYFFPKSPQTGRK